MSDKKHLYWVIGLVLITIILSGTLIWINYNSWTIRFEMDANTKEAIESIGWEEIGNNEIKTECLRAINCIENPELEGCTYDGCNWQYCNEFKQCDTTLVACWGEVNELGGTN